MYFSKVSNILLVPTQHQKRVEFQSTGKYKCSILHYPTELPHLDLKQASVLETLSLAAKSGNYVQIKYFTK
jgi:hypothetical protein